MKGSRKIDILLVDDQPVFIKTLKTYLESRNRQFHIVGLAYNGLEAIKLAREKKPDIILLDIKMPEMDGIKAAEAILKESPSIKILMLTTFDDNKYIRGALDIGVMGFILKEDIDSDDLIAFIKAALSDSLLFSKRIAPKLIRQTSHQLIDNGQSSQPPATEAGQGPSVVPFWFRILSRKEKDILRLLLNGCDNAEIAAQAFVAEQTVKNYLSVIYSKLDTHNRVQTIRKALEILPLLKEPGP